MGSYWARRPRTDIDADPAARRAKILGRDPGPRRGRPARPGAPAVHAWPQAVRPAEVPRFAGPRPRGVRRRCRTPPSCVPPRPSGSVAASTPGLGSSALGGEHVRGADLRVAPPRFVPFLARRVDLATGRFLGGWGGGVGALRLARLRPRQPPAREGSSQVPRDPRVDGIAESVATSVRPLRDEPMGSCRRDRPSAPRDRTALPRPRALGPAGRRYVAPGMLEAGACHRRAIPPGPRRPSGPGLDRGRDRASTEIVPRRARTTFPGRPTTDRTEPRSPARLTPPTPAQERPVTPCRRPPPSAAGRRPPRPRGSRPGGSWHVLSRRAPT